MQSRSVSERVSVPVSTGYCRIVDPRKTTMHACNLKSNNSGYISTDNGRSEPVKADNNYNMLACARVLQTS